MQLTIVGARGLDADVWLGQGLECTCWLKLQEVV